MRPPATRLPPRILPAVVGLGGLALLWPLRRPEAPTGSGWAAAEAAQGPTSERLAVHRARAGVRRPRVPTDLPPYLRSLYLTPLLTPAQ